MLWFYLSLATAISVATSDALSKLALKECDALVIAWVRWTLTLPFLFLIIPFMEMPSLGPRFWVITACAIPLEITAIILYMKAIKISPLSLTIPFLAFSPVFLIGTSYLLMGEKPDLSGFSGILLIAVGAYLLNVNHSKDGLLMPIIAIKKEKGSILMIVVAFIYSITAVLGKMAIIESSPLFFAISYPLLITLCLTPFAFRRVIKEMKSEKEKGYLFLLIGLTFAVMLVCHFSAVRLVEVAYMISIKRTSIIFSVIYGGLLFREKDMKERLLGSMIMVCGVALILL